MTEAQIEEEKEQIRSAYRSSIDAHLRNASRYRRLAKEYEAMAKDEQTKADNLDEFIGGLW